MVLLGRNVGKVIFNLIPCHCLLTLPRVLFGLSGRTCSYQLRRMICG